MRRVHAIEESFAFRGHMRRIEDAEQTREFCKHGMTHLLDVARIAWIFNLERGLGFDREVVYAAALLHDLGRSEQYATGEDHDVAGARIAADILDSLPDGLRFDVDERAVILAAVSGHRGACADGEVVVAPRAAEVPTGEADDRGHMGSARHASGTHRGEGAESLAHLIKEADNRSRACYACRVRDACYWPDERKNLSIDI